MARPCQICTDFQSHDAPLDNTGLRDAVNRAARTEPRGWRGPHTRSCDFDRRSARDVVVRNGIVDKVAMPLVDRFFAEERLFDGDSLKGFEPILIIMRGA